MEDQFRIQNNVKVNQYQQKQERYLAFIGAMYINMKGTDVYNGQNIDMVKKEKNLRILGTTRNILQEQHMKAGDTALIKDRVRSNVNIKKNKAIIKFTNIYIYQAKPHETYQVRVRRKTCLNQAQTVERH